ncbi:MAG: hypothetical protein LC808_07100, partial [Actinobacteria bacterium]|nr:hypothetical protein [Actinomycetota bacterium]
MAKPLSPRTILITALDPDGAAAVFRLTASTGAATLITSEDKLVTPVGVAVDATGAVLVADADAFGGKGGVIRVDPATGD